MTELTPRQILDAIRAELSEAQDVERRGRELADAAMHLLAEGNAANASRLLRRARVLHATPEVQLLTATLMECGLSGGGG